MDKRFVRKLLESPGGGWGVFYGPDQPNNAGNPHPDGLAQVGSIDNPAIERGVIKSVMVDEVSQVVMTKDFDQDNVESYRVMMVSNNTVVEDFSTTDKTEADNKFAEYIGGIS